MITMMQSNSIEVKFVLDKDGNPQFIEAGGRKHYKIEVGMKAFPEDSYAVQYQLDSSYINPLREETNKDDAFRFKTTTYGDYSISAAIMGRKSRETASAIISRALKESHSGDLDNSQILDAIETIMKY
jgi:hypothetical protein